MPATLYYASMEYDGLFNEKSNGKSRSGRARMAGLNPEERKALAIKAAKARWNDDLDFIEATHLGEIGLAGGAISLPCAVLQDGTRVLTQAEFLSAIGRRGGPKNTFKESGKVAPFLEAANLKPFISAELRDASQPIPFKKPSGAKSWGYRADILPMVCEMYLRARQDNALLPAQKAIAQACEVLVRALAHVGIIALVDEATGYQADRARDALAKILEAYIAKELQPWVRTFPSGYYQNLFRLRGLDFASDTPKRPQYFGVLTNDIVYNRLAPGVLAELKKGIPRNERTGRPTAKYFQKLTSNVGYPKLREHLGAVVALMKVSNNYVEFHALLDRLYPPQVGQLLLPYDAREDDGKGI